MRAGGHDLPDLGRVEGVDVLIGHLLKRVLVSHPACGVAGAGLTLSEDREVDMSRLHQLRSRDRTSAGALVIGGRAADPEQDVRRLFARLEYVDAKTLRPMCAVRLRLAPGVGGAIDVAQHRGRISRTA